MAPSTYRPLCFKHPLILCFQCQAQVAIGASEILEQIRTGKATCPRCRQCRDLHDYVRDFPVFGAPEALFGLDLWTGRKDIPQTAHAHVMTWDVGLNLPYEGRVVYANVTPLNAGGFDEVPQLFAPQEVHKPWSTHMRFYVPPGGKRAVSLSLVVKPKGELELARELALQAVDAFHRDHLNVSAILLGASVEASLRERLRAAYAARSVSLDKRAGLSGLLERARMTLNPPPGSQLVGALQELSKKARNPSAHGAAVALLREEVASWMVDAALTFEWCRLAEDVAVSQ